MMLPALTRNFGFAAATNPVVRRGLGTNLAMQLNRRFFGGAPPAHGHETNPAGHDSHGHGDHGHGGHDHPYAHGPRDHLNEDGTLREFWTCDAFHWYDLNGQPEHNVVTVNGQQFVKGIETRNMHDLFGIPQVHLPFWARNRLNIWGNYPLLLKAEFLFFYIPTFIIMSLVIPAFCMIYMLDEAVYTTMTVKVIGRQWYWVYEVEAPTDDE